MKGFIMKQNITTRSLSLTDTDFVATDSLIKCWKCNLYFQNAVKHVLYVQKLLNSFLHIWKGVMENFLSAWLKLIAEIGENTFHFTQKRPKKVRKCP